MNYPNLCKNINKSPYHYQRDSGIIFLNQRTTSIFTTASWNIIVSPMACCLYMFHYARRTNYWVYKIISTRHVYLEMSAAQGPFIPYHVTRFTRNFMFFGYAPFYILFSVCCIHFIHATKTSRGALYNVRLWSFVTLLSIYRLTLY